jgi:signal transduction histidine kinase
MSAARPLRRDPEHAMLAGVCAGVARWLGVDALVVRVAMLAITLAGGVGVLVYAVAAVALPAEEGAGRPRSRLPERGAIEVALGVGLLALSVLLVFRASGLWFSDAIVWPVALVAAGGALLWRTSAARETEEPPEPRAAVVSRASAGVALVIAAGLVFLEATGALDAARDALLGALAVAIVLAVIFAPLIVRMARSLSAERAARIRSQERAEVAAHLHDSVLQTLALVQQRADDPRVVATLARRQERELRAWLSGRDAGAGHVRSALETAAEEVEQRHGVAVEVVVVGDAPLDDAGEAVVAAAREAMVNAAKFAPGAPVDVYAEARDGRLAVYVRDRGPGFDPAGVPPDRQGVRESIIGRMTRHGGRADIHPAPGGGTEVELVLER